jgi:hypothetical protein
LVDPDQAGRLIQQTASTGVFWHPFADFFFPIQAIDIIDIYGLHLNVWFAA